MVNQTCKKSLLIYAHYYYPDVASTGQILTELALGLKDTFDITVICTVPSYSGEVSKEYKTHRFYHEEIDGIKVIRIRVPDFTKANKISRINNIISYYFGARKVTRETGAFDYVFSISQPPVLGGLLGVYGKKVKKAKFIYNIQDFNPEQTIAVGYLKNKLILNIMLMLDNYSCRKSDLVITVGRDLVDRLTNRFHGSHVPEHTLINNWIDESITYPIDGNDSRVVEFKSKYGLQDKFVIMYSGNMGLYYDLDGILKIIEKFPAGTKAADGREVAFAFVGDGTILNSLLEYKQTHLLENVIFIPYQAKEDLVYSLNAADVHWCVNAKGIKGVSCPSKFYGIAAVAKPTLAVLEQGSEIACLIEESGCGLIAEPGDYDKIEDNLRYVIEHASSDELISMGRKGRKYLEERLTKDISIAKYREAILNC